MARDYRTLSECIEVRLLQLEMKKAAGGWKERVRGLDSLGLQECFVVSDSLDSLLLLSFGISSPLLSSSDAASKSDDN